MNILFTCAGRRTYLLKYFKEALGNNGLIIGTDMQLTAPALTVADIVEQVPNVYADDYIDITLNICKKHKVDAVISLNDLELPILADKKMQFENEGIRVIVSSPDVIDICFDKYKTAQYITSLGLKSPKTFINYSKALEAIHSGQLIFPLVLKPRWGSGSIGVEFINNMEELEIVYNLLKGKIKGSILGNVSLENEYILIQEKIEGPEYGLDIINNLQGENQGVSVKHKLSMRAGETDKAITIDNADIRYIGKIIGTNLRHIANLDCDILERNHEYYVLELNPRFGGGYPFSHEAGVNLPKAIIAWLNNKKVEEKWFIPEYGKMYSKCDTLISIKY